LTCSVCGFVAKIKPKHLNALSEVGVQTSFVSLPIFAFWEVLNECGGLQRSCGATVVAGSMLEMMVGI
jgi:hypothetical protein